MPCCLSQKLLVLFLIVGILRSGGDTNYACLLDILPVWLFSIPLGYVLVSLQAPHLVNLSCDKWRRHSQANLGHPSCLLREMAA